MTLRITTIGCLLGLALLAASCQKNDAAPVACAGDCTIISGQLTTGQPQAGLANATVTAKWITSNGLFVKGKVKATTTTSTDGRYTLSFRIDDAELADGYCSVFFTPDKNQYYTIGEPAHGFHHLTRDTVVTVPAYHIPRKAFVRLAITNQPQLVAAKGEFTSDFSTCYGHNTVFSRALQGGGAVLFWNSLPTENPLPIAGDQSVLFRSSKTKNGVTTHTVDSLFVPAGTTRAITVSY